MLRSMHQVEERQKELEDIRCQRMGQLQTSAGYGDALREYEWLSQSAWY